MKKEKQIMEAERQQDPLESQSAVMLPQRNYLYSLWSLLPSSAK